MMTEPVPVTILFVVIYRTILYHFMQSSLINNFYTNLTGSGIFVSPSSALQRAGSVGEALIIWAVSGGISLLGNYTVVYIAQFRSKVINTYYVQLSC